MPEAITIEAAGREVRLSNPDKVFFPKPGHTKLHLCNYYLEVADAAVNHLRERPTTMKRFVDGAEGEPFFQKRVPKGAPEWLQTATVKFPSGRSARELVANDAAHLAWAVNLGVIDFNPWPSRRADLDHPDELRVDLDPTPGVRWNTVRKVALCVREVLSDHGLTGFPKTSGSRGIHVNVRVEPDQDFTEVRRAALALAREVERRVPKLATSKWWKEERHGVFVDYNQNARDLRLDTVPARLKECSDPSADIDSHVGSLDGLLELAARDEAGGLGDAPWPPHFRKQRGEPKRVQPSRAKKKSAGAAGLRAGLEQDRRLLLRAALVLGGEGGLVVEVRHQPVDLDALLQLAPLDVCRASPMSLSSNGAGLPSALRGPSIRPVIFFAPLAFALSVNVSLAHPSGKPLSLILRRPLDHRRGVDVGDQLAPRVTGLNVGVLPHRLVYLDGRGHPRRRPRRQGPERAAEAVVGAELAREILRRASAAVELKSLYGIGHGPVALDPVRAQHQGQSRLREE